MKQQVSSDYRGENTTANTTVLQKPLIMAKTNAMDDLSRQSAPGLHFKESVSQILMGASKVEKEEGFVKKLKRKFDSNHIFNSGPITLSPLQKPNGTITGHIIPSTPYEDHENKLKPGEKDDKNGVLTPYS